MYDDRLKTRMNLPILARAYRSRIRAHCGLRRRIYPSVCCEIFGLSLTDFREADWRDREGGEGAGGRGEGGYGRETGNREWGMGRGTGQNTWIGLDLTGMEMGCKLLNAWLREAELINDAPKSRRVHRVPKGLLFFSLTPLPTAPK